MLDAVAVIFSLNKDDGGGVGRPSSSLPLGMVLVVLFPSLVVLVFLGTPPSLVILAPDP
jgi:hypothetical protein